MRLKPELYASIGIREYLIVDTTGLFLPEKLLLKTLTKKQKWTDRYDRGKGVDSIAGFRVQIDPDGEVRVADRDTGRRYPRPQEAADLFDEVERLKAELANYRKRKPTTGS